MPSVSVITPAFNAAATVERAWRSLETQTFTDWEYIVVDDGSTDHTSEIVSSFDDPRLCPLVQIANSGTGAALNAGIRQATGDYLAFLDADDEFLPEHLATHVAVMEHQPAIDLLWGGIELVVKEESQAWVPDMDRGQGLIRVSDCVVQGTLFARRPVCRAILYSEDRSVWFQDYDFVQRLRAAGFNVQRFHQPTYRYYRDSGSSQVDSVKATWDVEQA
jgi:glycosyltransferase involved in cell wall biosynthesis